MTHSSERETGVSTGIPVLTQLRIIRHALLGDGWTEGTAGWFIRSDGAKFRAQYVTGEATLTLEPKGKPALVARTADPIQVMRDNLSFYSRARAEHGYMYGMTNVMRTIDALTASGETP